MGFVLTFSFHKTGKMTLVSQRNYWKQYIAFPVLFVIFTICFLFLLRDVFKDRYVNLPLLLFDLIFIVLAIVGLAGMLRFDKILIEADQLYIYSMFGRKKADMHLPAITSWAETELESKGSVIRSFTIFDGASKYTFKSSYYKNYDTLKAAITPYGFQDHERAAKLKAASLRRTGILILTLSLLLIAGGLCFYVYQSKEVLPEQVATIGDAVANTPEIDVGSKGGKSMRIRLQHYPDFVFKVSGNTYKAMDAQGYVANVQVGDSIFITLDKGVYERKFLHVAPLTFMDKYWDYSSVKLYGLRTGSRSFLSLEGYNRGGKSLFGPLVICLFGGVWAGLGGLMIRRGNQQKTAVPQ